MSTEVILPKIGFEMNEGVLTEWLAADGDNVEEGKPLFTFESEKSVQEIESPATGVLKIIASPGETYDVGTVLATIS